MRLRTVASSVPLALLAACGGARPAAPAEVPRPTAVDAAQAPVDDATPPAPAPPAAPTAAEPVAVATVAPRVRGTMVEERFTGRITGVSFGCAIDASCDLEVDDTKSVHFGHGEVADEISHEWGSADAIWTLQRAPNQGVGRRVEVFAATSDGYTYTIQGSRGYYIRLLD